MFKINKLQLLCNNQIDDTQLFGLALLIHTNLKILGEEKSDILSLEDREKLAIDEMELVYSECKAYLIKKRGNHYKDLFTFEMFRDKAMAVISNPVIARYRILKSFFISLADDNSDEARIFLKKNAILDEKGRIQEFIFAPSFDGYAKEKKQLESIQKTCS